MTTPSPCVKNCCLDENDVCLGCGRTVEEIMLWGVADEKQKQEIMQRVRERLSEESSD